MNGIKAGEIFYFISCSGQVVTLPLPLKIETLEKKKLDRVKK